MPFPVVITEEEVVAPVAKAEKVAAPATEEAAPAKKAPAKKAAAKAE
ncbi:hypothetical protein [Pedobacter sp. PACM 27299]|nr:hypothetical protein [Pedobacter sp. PACM 27299]